MAHQAVINVVSYVEGLEGSVRDLLFRSPWTCQAVMRSLSPLAKQYVLRLLWIQRPVTQADVDGWISGKEFGVQHHEAIEKLEGLGLFQIHTLTEGGANGYMLHETFQSQIQWALAGGGLAVAEPPPEASASAPVMEELDDFAHTQWESLQMYILTTISDAPQLPTEVPSAPLDLHRLLVAAGLLQGPRTDRSITSDGFQFLLKDNYRQLWAFLTEYIRDAESRSNDELSSVLSFLMQLGFRRVGQPCSWSELQSDRERSIAAHMMQLGLLRPFSPAAAKCEMGISKHHKKPKLEHEAQRLFFCPTRLASSLCAGFSHSAMSANADIAGGHIIVETNYRVYAFTSSKVQVAILELFCRCDCKLPNMFVGTLTRDSVLKAVAKGITSDEIITYLHSRAHPQASARAPEGTIVPEVVTEQIQLWEAETVRVRYTECNLYEGFESPALYTSAVQFARSQGALLWNDDVERRFAGHCSDHEQIRGFIKSMKDELIRSGDL